MRKLMSGVEGPTGAIRAESLTRTISQNPPDRPALLDALAHSTEITKLAKGRKLTTGQEPFKQAVGGFILADAHAAYAAGDWSNARERYQAAWNAGYQNAEVAHGLGVAWLAGFPFAASEQEKEQAESYLRKAIELDPKQPDAYKSLGELYGEWDRYEDGISMYQSYLKLAPNASDRSRIEREIRNFERKARR